MSVEELEGYRQQIALIDHQLLVVTDASARENIVEMRKDLVELTTLLEEQLAEDTSVINDLHSQCSKSSIISDQGLSDLDDFVGMRCYAPFSRAQLPISHHSAIILEVVAPNPIEEKVQVRVLYSNPMLTSMRPCIHFLSATCHFEEKCKYSHGELIPMELIEQYKEPNFESLTNDSLVLVEVNDCLWDIGRIVALDHKEVAVQLIESGREVSAKLEKILPLDEDIQDSVEEEIVLPVRNNSYQELKGDRVGRITVGDLGNWSGGGFGLKLMQKMGYKIGDGLGKNSDGIVHAIQATAYPKYKSVDICMESKKYVVDGVQKTKTRLRKEMDHTKNSLDMDIFEFLNRKLDQGLNKTQAEIIKEEKREMEKSSSRLLGIKGLDLESELKQLKTKQKKLRDGILRNKHDKRTVERLKTSLVAIEREMEKVRSKHERLHSELTHRQKKKKDVF